MIFSLFRKKPAETVETTPEKSTEDLLAEAKTLAEAGHKSAAAALRLAVQRCTSSEEGSFVIAFLHCLPDRRPR